MISALNSPITVSAKALSYESPTLPTDGAMSASPIAAYLGHRSTRQAEVYTRKADKGLLAAEAFRVLDGWASRLRMPAPNIFDREA